MHEPPDDTSDPPRSASETLAELVARRKTRLNQSAAKGPRGGPRETERAAAARSAFKSKPAPRK